MLSDIGALEAVLLAAALLIGATGTWSPCGFSMVETIGPTGHTGGRATTLAACATFLPGALAGALLTFGGLALAGEVLHGAGGTAGYAVAAVLALAAAVAEARGTRIAPQIRRQLPEHWRRVMPMPVAAALYGVLLGLGFTTFVLSFGVWALAGIALALGEPAAGLGIGIGFGIGRAVPIVLLAPIADRPAGAAVIGLMGERPGLYRGIRLGDAVALLVAGGMLIGSSVAAADVKFIERAADPSVAEGSVAFQRGDARGAKMRTGEALVDLPGTDPALGGSYAAVLQGDEVVILDRATRDELGRFPAPGVDAVAISARTVAYRTRVNNRDRLLVRRFSDPASPRAPRAIAGVSAPSQIGRPSVHGSRVAYAVSKSKANRIEIAKLGEGKRTILKSVRVGLTNPALRSSRMLYVREKKRRSQLMLLNLGKGGGQRSLLSKGRTLWSTALAPHRAYVTVLRGGSDPRPEIVSVRP